MSTEIELAQSAVINLTETEAKRLLARVKNSAFLHNRGIEVYTVPHEPMIMNDGSKQPAVTVMVRAETDKACGIGVGFLTALSEGAI